MTRRRWLLLGVGLLGAGVAVAAVSCGATTRPDGGKGLLAVGASAPALEGTDQHGEVRRIADGRGKYLVVFFYPKDGTPGCTAEACAFRDAWDRYERAGVLIYGVSADDRASHAAFAKEHALPFPIIADPEHTWSQAFGVGRLLGMSERVSFLLDPEGKIVRSYPDVDPGVHAEQVLGDVARLK